MLRHHKTEAEAGQNELTAITMSVFFLASMTLI